MSLEMLLKEAAALTLPCFDLVPAGKGDRIVAHWRGRRSDLPEKVPSFVIAIKSHAHLLSVDDELFQQLGLIGQGPLALAVATLSDGDERLNNLNVSTGDLSKVVFEDSVPLTARPASSLPPIEALLLYGGAPVQEWLKSQGLERWQYEGVSTEIRGAYTSVFNEQLPLFANNPPCARVGGWHISWPDDDFYIPREMQLMVWTFQDSEPWYEVFLSPLKNYVIKTRIT